MPDMEKVIGNLTSLRERLKWQKDIQGYGVYISFVDDAIDLLKEQEAVEPYVTGRGETFETAETWWYACGNCNEALDVNDKYCRHCGTPVLWEGR